MRKSICLIICLIMLLPMLFSCGDSSYELLGNYIYDVYNMELLLRGEQLKINICFDGKSALFLINEYKSKDKENYGIEFLDMNFDGNMDFRVLTSIDGKKEYYSNYVYDQKAGIFKANAYLNEIYSPVFDSEKVVFFYETSIVHEAIGDTPESITYEYGKEVYIWDGLILRLNEKKALFFYTGEEVACYEVYDIDEKGNIVDSIDKWLFDDFENIKIEDYIK